VVVVDQMEGRFWLVVVMVLRPVYGDRDGLGFELVEVVDWMMVCKGWA